jgi:hypothetical protein
LTDAFLILSIFFGMASVVAVPLAVVLGLPLLAWNARALIRLKERELDLRRIETAMRIRTEHALPHYVNADDPGSVLAWASASRELARH